MGDTQPPLPSGSNGHASDIRLLRMNSGGVVNLGFLQIGIDGERTTKQPLIPFRNQGLKS